MKKIDFSVPFSGTCSLTFLNCFASSYLFIEGLTEGINEDDAKALQEKYLYLFDAMSGHSALCINFDQVKTAMEDRINSEIYNDGGSDNTIEFLFGFTGYTYTKITQPNSFISSITASIDANKPIIAKLKENAVSFAVITGYDDNTLLCPEFKPAQKEPDPAVTYENLDALYIIGEKTSPKYNLLDGLNRIREVMQYNLSDGIWDKCMQKIGTYGPDSLGEDSVEGKKIRMNRLANIMWNNFNCHNFAEVFRVFDQNSYDKTVYDSINDVKKLSTSACLDSIHTINWRYGYTHDLSWSIIGLNGCINWEEWLANYYGDMLEVILLKIKENDEAVLECVKNIIRILS